MTRRDRRVDLQEWILDVGELLAAQRGHAISPSENPSAACQAAVPLSGGRSRSCASRGRKHEAAGVSPGVGSRPCSLAWMPPPGPLPAPR